MRIIITAVLFILSLASWAYTPEKIYHFDSKIKVQTNGVLKVTETITVQVNGQQIKRGIFRTFPTIYYTENGGRKIVKFEVQSVKRNGSKEPYHMENINNGKVVYIGSKSNYLKDGIHKFEIQYITDRQILFQKEKDELVWNATGNYWDFNIDSVSATVYLPEKAQIHDLHGYSGEQGAKGCDDCSWTILKDSSTAVFTISPTKYGLPALGARQGFTIALNWNKGVVSPPSSEEQRAYFIRDYKPEIFGVAGFLVVMIYYLITWYIVGKDPKKGAITPRFYPPKDLSPAALAYISKMGYKNKAFAALLVNLGVQGILTIEQDSKSTYILNRTDKSIDDADLSNVEKKVAKRLFQYYKEIRVKGSYDSKYSKHVLKSLKKLKNGLSDAFEKKLFFLNIKWFMIGIFLSIGCAGFMLYHSINFGFLSLGIFFAGIFLFVIVSFFLYGLIKAIRTRNWRTTTTVSIMLFAIIATNLYLFRHEIIILLKELPFLTFIPLIIMGCLGILNFIFYELLKAPTIKGRKIMDEIEGFQLYLETAEEKHLDALNPPDKTPELFEQYLPYAIALGVENKWGEKFNSILKDSSAGKQEGYQPTFYTGVWAGAAFSATSFSSDLSGSFASSIGSTATVHSSSSGGSGFSSGGGFSGGGGGGGGGGGW